MSKEELIQKFKELDIFCYNDYFYKYIDLIYENINTQKELYITQRHHVIPLSYYMKKYSLSRLQAEKFYKKESKYFIMNLKQKDHLLAHSFLYLSLKDNNLKLANYFALIKMLKSKTTLSEKEIEDLIVSEDYQKAYEEGKKLFSKMSHQRKENNLEQWEKHTAIMRSNQVRKKISETMKKVRKENADHIYIHKDKEEKRISPALLDDYIRDGWEQGALRGVKCRLHNGNGQEKTVFKDEVDRYLQEGWVLGGRPGRLSPEHKAKLAASHNNVTDKFREEQSARLKSFYKNNPNWKTRSKHAIKIIDPETGQEYIFDSCIAFCRGTDIPEYIARGGMIKVWVKLGYVKRKKSIYNNWKIMYI